MESSKYPQALPVGTALLSPGTAGNPPRRYVIQGVLGAGGFGITYKATTRITFQNLPVDISVAIKEHFVNRDCRRSHDGSVTSTDGYRDEVEASRKAFRTEARRLNEISGRCPYIISVNEVFDANETTYYVMEFVDGKTLSDYVSHHVANTGRPLSEEEALALFRPLSEAVSFLHDNRVLHQDIKPGNVMLCLNEHGRLYPKLIDFGLSKHYDAQGQPTSTINMAGYSEGYAPLEQYRGVSSFAPTVDVYALGATLYFMLTGTRPRPAGDMLPDDIRTALLAAGVSTVTCEAVVHAMEESRNYRTPDVRTFMQELGGTGSHTERPISPTPRSDIRQETPFQTKVEEIKDATAPNKKKSKGKAKALIIFSVLLLLLAGGFAAPSLFDGCSDSDKKGSSKGKSEDVTITKKDGRGNVKVETVKEKKKESPVETVKEKKKENPKPVPKTKSDSSKKGNNKDNTLLPPKANHLSSI
ncbi:MAG: serine/threonine-protein kinase [Bacteroidales bacterium]|nr:serine/threonine-protein kinase [Bacteroidales bacterium]